MQKYVCDPIILPDNHTWQDLEDAKLSADWRRVVTRDEMMSKTDLSDKCGSCKYFRLYEGTKNRVYGCCDKGFKGYRRRTNPKCKQYEELEQ